MAEPASTSTHVQVIVKIQNTHFFINNNIQYMYLST